MCAQTTWSMNMTTPTSCCGESHRYRVVCICAARHSKTLNSQLEAELSTFVQGNPCLMPLSSLLWVFLAFTFSGRDASKHGCECSGWKDCTQARGASQGLGEERRIGEKQASYDFSMVCKYLSPKLVDFLHYFVHYFSSVFFFFPWLYLLPHLDLQAKPRKPTKVSVCGLPRNNTENTALIFGEKNQFCMVYFNLNKMWTLF